MIRSCAVAYTLHPGIGIGRPTSVIARCLRGTVELEMNWLLKLLENCVDNRSKVGARCVKCALTDVLDCRTASAGLFEEDVICVIWAVG